MKNAKRTRAKKNSKASQKVGKGTTGRKAKQPVRRAESPTKKKRVNTAAKLKPTKHEKTSTEIFNEIRAKGGTFKDLARSFGVSEKDFRAHRKFLLGIPGGKRIKSISREDVLKEAKRNKVDKSKEITIFKGQIVGERHVKVPKRILTEYKYIHVLYTVQFTYTDGTTSEQVKGQIYQTKDGHNTIQALAIEFFETLVDYPYVHSIKLLRFGYRYF